ncbi:MAG: malectin [Verrucomicrobiota bacterium]
MKQRLFLLPITAGALTLVSGCQTCCKDSSKQSAALAATALPVVAAAPVALSKPLRPTLRINAGAGAIQDASGVTWQSDNGFSGGDVIERPDIQIANTQQPELYRSEHYAMDGFTQKLPNGKYQVKLHFCETYEGINGAGERVFSFDVEGKSFKDFDVWAKSGGGARAYVETVPVEIADGELTIKFTPQIENPQINGIEIIPVL